MTEVAPGSSAFGSPDLPDKETGLDAEPCGKFALPNEPGGMDPALIAAQEKLDAAARVVQAYANKHPESFTGQRICQTSETLFVYRVAGDEVFDARAKQAARDHKVRVVLTDTPYSMVALRKVHQAIMKNYLDDLERADAKWLGSGVSRLGWVEVGVEHNFNAARAVLAEFGDRVHVVQGHEAKFD